MPEITALQIDGLKKSHSVTVLDPLPAVVDQVGSTCGIYALDCALRIRGIKAPPPRKGKGPPPPPDPKMVSPSLRQLAKESGLTKIGELFDEVEVVLLAALAGATEAAVHRFDEADGLWDVVTKAVGGKGSVLFPFCVDNSVANDSKPKTDGKNPHWCLLIGGYDDKGTKHILATQYGKFYDWTLEGLVASNKSLQLWNAQDWGKLCVSQVKNGKWEEAYRGWSNKTTPPAWLKEWEEAAKGYPNLVKVEWLKTASFSEINLALTLRGQCVVV